MEKNTLARVYVVDDDAGVRKSLKALISNAGYAVECFSSAEAFLERADLTLHACALIDLCLKQMDGIDLQRQLLSDESHLAIIMMSAYGEIGAAVNAMRMGAADFIEKPFEPDELLTRLQSVADALVQVEFSHLGARQNAALLATLTPREYEVLARIVDGKSNKMIANEFNISPRTVETHRGHIMDKLNVDSLAHVVRLWFSAQRSVEIAVEQSAQKQAASKKRLD